MRALRLMLLLAAIIPQHVARMLGQTPTSSESDAVEFIQHAPSSAQGAEALEAALKANPDDRIAHIRLMGYYWSQATFYKNASVRGSLVEQADWFAIHEPQSVVFDRTGFSFDQKDFAPPHTDDWTRYRASWISAVKRYPDDTAVLLHAQGAMQGVDLDVPFFCAKQLRVLMPTNPQFAVGLAGLYVQVISIQMQRTPGTASAFTQLMDSRDSAVVGLTGQAIVAGSKLGGKPSPLDALGPQLLKKAQELDPANRRWSDALSAPAQASVADVAIALNELRQEDLWPGGKVTGMVVPADALKVDATAQAEKLVSPNAAFLRYALGSQSIPPGEVSLLALIGPDGHVQQTQFDLGSARLFAQATSMVRSWQYTPTLVDGRPVSVVTKIDLNFTVPPAHSPLPVAGALGMGGMLGATGPPAVVPDPVLESASPNTIKVSSDVLDSLVLSNPLIPYPTGTKRYAAVVLKVLLSKDGTVKELKVVSGDAEFQQAALEGVKKWTYRPYSVGGEAVEVQSSLTVLFPHEGNGGYASKGVFLGNGTGISGGLGNSSMPLVSVVPGRPGPERLSAGVVAGNRIAGATPVYPPLAKAAHVSGAVVLHAIISKSGDIDDLTVISGPDMLREPALKAVRSWKYKPYLLLGKPTAVDTTITVNFMFSDGSAPTVPAPIRAAEPGQP